VTTKAFSITLQELRDGRLHAELTAKFAELIQAVKSTGKGGEVILKLKVKPASRGSEIDKVTIADILQVNVPKPDRGEDFFWLTDDGGLSRNHPRQGNLDLRDASHAAPSTLKEASK
jgi:hypothetical protein